MIELIKHIEKLLPEHDCVVVPGLGGFVQNEVSASFDPRSDVFYPGGKEICFNAKLTFNDGFLVQSYQETLNLSFEESNLLIHQGVQELMNKLNEGKYVSLDLIGVMWKNNQGQLSFRSENRNSFSPDAFGLTSFSYPTLEKRLRKKSYVDYQLQKHKESEFINIRLRRNSFRNLITGIAACLFMLLLSKPAGNLPQTANQEAFLMHNYLSPSKDIKVAEVAKDAEEVVGTVRSTEKSTSLPETTVQPKIAEATPIQVTTGNVSGKKTVSITPPHSYYIIVGSFPKREIANDWMKQQSQKSLFNDAGIIESGQRARVYIRSFSDKKTANAYLNQFRTKNPDYATAWLFSTKNK